MLGNNRYLAVIPARGGSTRLPRKNIRPLLGKPLIAWTIKAAKNSKLLDRILVSTDDEKIKEVALEYEVEVRHRPRELASDRSLIVDTLYFISKENPGFNIVLMNPTSPIRSKGLVDKCIIEFDKNNYDTLASGIIIKLVPWPHSQIRTQDTKGFFIDNGAVYVFKESLIH